MTGFIVALRQTLGARGLDLFQCITCAGHFILPYLHPSGPEETVAGVLRLTSPPTKKEQMEQGK